MTLPSLKPVFSPIALVSTATITRRATVSEVVLALTL